MPQDHRVPSLRHGCQDARSGLWSGASALAMLVAFSSSPAFAQGTCTFTSDQDTGANTFRSCVEQANAETVDTVTSGLAPHDTVALQNPVEIRRDLTIGAGGPPIVVSNGFARSDTDGWLGLLQLTTGDRLTVTDAVTIRSAGDSIGAIDVSGVGGTLDFSGRIETTGSFGGGIYFGDYDYDVPDGGVNAAIVHMRGTITTSGYGAVGAGTHSNDNRFFLYGAIETTGRSATGVSAEGFRNEFHLLEGSAITVSGQGSDGIFANTGDSKILVDGTITTQGEAEGISAGQGANGITVLNYGDVGNEIRLRGNGAIVTEAEQAVGIYTSGGGNRIILEPGSRIETRGALAAAGISARDGDNRVEVTGATVTTNGTNSNAIVATGAGNQVVLGQDGKVVTRGQGSHGVHAGTSGGSVTLAAGAGIETQGNFAYGINAGLNAVMLDAGSEIVTAGRRAYGISLSTQMTGLRGNATIAGSIATSGEYAAGIEATAGRSDITIKSGGSVVTTGASAPGEIIPHALSLRGGGNIVTVENGALVSTTAANAHGIWAGGTTGNNLVYVGGTVSATGAGANAVRFTTGTNLLELRPGYAITGDVVGTGNDILAFGGSGDAAFDLAKLGTQYTGFNALRKSGDATWELTGDGTAYTGFLSVNSGRLNVTGSLTNLMNVQSGATLGGTGTLGVVHIADGGILAPGSSPGALTVDSLVLNNGSVLDFELGAPGVAAASDRIDVAGNLTLDGILNVSDAGGFGNGVYTLINYGALVADNGLDLGTTPTGYTYAIDAGTGTASAVTLEVAGGTGGNGGTNQYWDGANTTPGNTLYGRGGAGVWNAGNTNWTSTSGTTNGVWGNQFGIFYNGTGDVTVEGAQSATGLQFAADGYRLVAGAGGSLNLTGPESRVRVDAGATATLALPVMASGFAKEGAGTLNLAGDSDIAGALSVPDGVLRIVDGAEVEALQISVVGGRLEVAGAGSALTATSAQGNAIAVGLAGAGELTVTGGGKVEVNASGAARIGRDAGGVGSVAITGAGSEMRVLDGGLHLGFGGGTGTIDVSHGGHLRVDGFIRTELIPGGGPLGGDLTRIIPTNLLVIGKDGGTAALNVTEGGTVTTGLMLIGDFHSGPDLDATTTANVVLDGPDSTIIVNENLEMLVGGTFTVSGGAQLRTFANSALASNPNRQTIAPDRIGWSSTRSTMTVTGAGSAWHAGNVIKIGDSSSQGTLTVEAGATVSSVEGIRAGNGRDRSFDGPSAILTVDNATLRTTHLDIANGGSWAEAAFTNGAIIETTGFRIGGGATYNSAGVFTARADILVSGPGTRWTDSAAPGPNSYLAETGTVRMTVTDGAVIDTVNRTIFGRGENYEDARADVQVLDGARFTTASSLELGHGVHGTGTLVVDGAGSRVEVGDSFEVGQSGKGDVAIRDNGAINVTGHAVLGAQEGGEGRITVTTGGQLTTDRISMGRADGASGFLTIGDGVAPARVETGGLDLRRGELLINSGGVLNLQGGAASVGAGGSVIGTGTIEGDLLLSGRVAPGAGALGTLNITGDATFSAGSVYSVDLQAPDQSDRIAIGGTALVDGGALEITKLSTEDSYVDGQTYTIVTAGKVDVLEDLTVNQPFALLRTDVAYEADRIDLTLTADVPFTTLAATFNQAQTALGLQDLAQTGDALAIYNTLVGLSLQPGGDEAVRRAFALSSGEIHASSRHVIDQTSTLFNRTLRYQGLAGVGAGNVGAGSVSAPLGQRPGTSRGKAGFSAVNEAAGHPDARARGAWAAPLGGFGRLDGDGNAGRLKWWNGGLAGGYEGVVDLGSGDAVAGLGFGYIRSHGSIDSRLSAFDSNGFYLGAYGAWADGPWTAASALSYGANRVSTDRNIAFADRTAKAKYWTHTVGLSGEASYAFDLGDTTHIAPLFTLDGGWSGHGSFTEKGAGALNLSSGSDSGKRLDTGLGLALSHVVSTDRGKMTLEGRAVWEHALADVVPSRRLSLAGSSTGFAVRGLAADRDRVRLGAGIAWDISQDMTVRARYDGLLSGDQINPTASLGLNIRF